MIVSRIGIVAALAAALGLQACSSDSESRSKLAAAVGSQVAAVAKGQRRSKERQPYTVITRKQLENTKVSALQINIESRGGSDVLRRAGQRQDDTAGTVSIWTGTGGTQVYTRNGVLVGTRGIGGDIISSDAGALISALSRASGGNGERRYFISNGGFGSRELVLSCDIENLGRATTQVVHLSYQTVHLRETCVGGAQDRVRIENEYWVQPSNGLVRRSRQWAGPYSGHFELILLRN